MLNRHHVSISLASVFNNAIRWGGCAFIAYMMYRSVSVLAGQQTMADIGIRILSDVRVSKGLAWVLGGGGVLYGFGERRLRRKTIERLQGRIRTLEQEVDPRRSTSALTPQGDTSPEDRL